MELIDELLKYLAGLAFLHRGISDFRKEGKVKVRIFGNDISEFAALYVTGKVNS